MDVEPSNKPQILIKTLSDRIIKLDYNPLLTIGQVKELLAEKEGLEAETHISLVRTGSLLPNSLPLSSIFASFESGKVKEEELEEHRKIYWFYYEKSAQLCDPIEITSEWDAKNRLKIFKGLYCFSQRRFTEAANLLCDSLSTFGETDFMPFVDCVKYAVIASSFSLDRPSLHKKVSLRFI